MKIAVFHELPVGGARRATNMFAPLLKHKHDVDLYTTQPLTPDEQKNYSHTFIFPFSAKVWKGHDWKTRLYKDTAELYKLAKLHEKIAQHINEKQYDIAFVQASQFLETPFILQFLSIPSVFYCHDPHYRMIYEEIVQPKGLSLVNEIYERTNRFVRKYLDRQNFAEATEIVANSKFAQRQIKKTYGRESSLCYLGVDETFFTPDNSIKKDIDVLYIGSKEPMDGYDLLDKALPLIKNNLNLVTLFSEENWISSDIEMRNLYRRAKMVVCTGVNEPFGLVPIEAMACGTPVVAVDEGGYPETVMSNKTGLLITRTPEALAESISWLLSHPKQAKAFGVQARKVVVQSWTWKASVQNLEKILQTTQQNFR